MATPAVFPIFIFAFLALSTMILVGLPIGFLLKRPDGLDYQILVILTSLVIGVAVVLIEYVHLVRWCYFFEQVPPGSDWGCLPGIQLSVLIGLVLAALMARFVTRRKSLG